MHGERAPRAATARSAPRAAADPPAPSSTSSCDYNGAEKLRSLPRRVLATAGYHLLIVDAALAGRTGRWDSLAAANRRRPRPPRREAR
jgi:hypothetical protein